MGAFMNWKRWLKFDPYKKLWFWAGRPFTYILRDLWVDFEYLWIIGFTAFGVWLGHNYNWLDVLVRLAWLTGGFLLGHLFWGAKQIYKQRGK